MRPTHIALLTAAALASCAPGNEDPAADNAPEAPNTDPAEDPEPAQAPEVEKTAWEVSDPDGTVFTTYIDADGAYRDFRDGAAWQAGGWRIDADQNLCFSPDGGGEANCWSLGRPGEDGVMAATSTAGLEIRARQVEYAPPESE